MKKQTAILLLFLFTSPFAWNQGHWMKTDTPCDKELLKKTPGEWLKPDHVYYAAVTKLQLQEIEK